MKIIRIGNVELTEQDAQEIAESARRYLVTYSKIYEVCHTKNGGYHGRVILANRPGMTRRGRFYRYGASEINWLVGQKLLNE